MVLTPSSQGFQRNGKPTKRFNELLEYGVQHGYPLPTLDNAPEMFWRYYYQDFSTKFCNECAGPTSFLAFGSGFREFCSCTCAAKARFKRGQVKGFATPEGWEKSRATHEHRHGTRSPSQVAETHSKQQGKIYRYYDLVSPAGNNHRVQGYERFVLPELWTQYGDVVITEKHLISSITYDDVGTARRYFPDFYLPNINTIIEVKSTYTIQCDPRLHLKKAAVEKHGIIFRLVVYDNRKRRTYDVDLPG